MLEIENHSCADFGEEFEIGRENGLRRQTQRGQPGVVLTGNMSSVHDLTFSPDGQRLAALDITAHADSPIAGRGRIGPAGLSSLYRWPQRVAELEGA